MISFKKLLNQIRATGIVRVVLAVFFGVIGGFLMLEAMRALLNLEGLFAEPVLATARDFIENIPGKEVFSIPLRSFLVRFNAASYLLMGSCLVFVLADKLLSCESIES